MILGLDEETESAGMRYYKERVRMPDFAIVPDSDFPLVNGEKGILIFDLAKKIGKPGKRRRIAEAALGRRGSQYGAGQCVGCDHVRKRL